MSSSLDDHEAVVADGGSLSLDVMKFAADRSDALASVDKLLQASSSATYGAHGVRNVQRLLRRRGASNIKWRWRSHKPRSIKSRLQAQTTSSRRDTRRAALFRARSAAISGLETEAWHVKRFTMASMFGIKLPLRSRDRASRAAVRAANQGCIVHDASYWRCLELRGADGEARALLQQTTDLTATALACVASGTRELVCTLREKCDGTAPSMPAAIAPARLLCRDGTWLIFVHQAAIVQARAALVEAAHARGDTVRVASGPAMLRFQLRGPTSHATLARSMCVVGEGSGADAWPRLRSLTSPAVLPPRTVLAGRMRLLTAPPEVKAGQADRHDAADGDSKRALRSLLRGGLDDRRTVGDGVGGARSDGASLADEASASTPSILLVQQPPPSAARGVPHAAAGADGSGAGGGAVAEAVGRRVRGGAGVRGLFNCGWDVLLPAGTSAGRALWQALILQGARAVGQEEMRAIALHAGQAFFPHAAPETAAGRRAAVDDATQRRAAEERRPPSQRPNYTALQTPHPFGPNWHALRDNSSQSMAATASAQAGMSDAAATAAATAAAAPLPPDSGPADGLLSLVRVRLRFTGKGRARVAACIHAAPPMGPGGAEEGGATADDAPPTCAASHPSPPRPPLLGFVVEGGFNTLAGRGTAIGYCAAAPVLEQMRAQGAASNQIAVLVRNPASRHFRSAVVTVS